MQIQWNGSSDPRALELLRKGGACIVTPTKVGYIIVATDLKGLERKFEAKGRDFNKPGVVLCGSIDQLKLLAEMNEEIECFYREHWERDILLGCILPWRDKSFIPDGCERLMMDRRGTSCFVIKFGLPSEMIVQELWETNRTLVFASSANPSGKGNRGRVSGIGEKIESSVDLVIAADDYVASIQPLSESRYEQGVMISMVDGSGELIPEQRGERSVFPSPTLIRKGLDVDKITAILCKYFNSWNYRHGEYY